MIELFGFWFNVTWISIFYFVFPAYLTVWILGIIINQVTEDEYKGQAFYRWFIEEDSYQHLLLFKRFVVHEGVVYVTIGLSFFAQLAFAAAALDEMINSEWTLTYSEILVDTIALISGSGLQHVTGWIAVLLTTYILSIQVLRRLYRTYVRVDELLKKVNER